MWIVNMYRKAPQCKIKAQNKNNVHTLLQLCKNKEYKIRIRECHKI